MSDFGISFKKTCKNEDGWVNDKDDNGKETWDGISRRSWPNLIIWDIIDHYKLLPGFPENLKGSSELAKAKPAFYYENYWKPLRGSEIRFQELADQLFDSAVNIGVGQAIILAKRVAGFRETPIMDDAFLNHLNDTL